MPQRELVLATDLDGTLAGGTAAERAELVARLTRAGARLVYVTGRTSEGAREVVTRASLPDPEVLIADVGTSVLAGMGPARVAEVETVLDAAWPGAAEVRARLGAVAELAPQEVEAPRRVSYWVEPVRLRRAAAAGAGRDPYAARPPGDVSLGAESAAVAERVARAAAAALEGLAVDVVLSANVFLDVLPRGVNKGTTLRRALRWMGAADDACVVAGDSLNDLALFQTGLRGIVVGNCEPALGARAAGWSHVYRARGEGAAGVLEGLRHHGHLTGRNDGAGTDSE